MSVLTCTVSVSNITSLHEWKESRQKGCGEGKEVEKVEVEGREGERERERLQSILLSRTYNTLVSLVPRPKFFAYVTRRKDRSTKNLGLVSTAGVLVRMRMHYLVMEE